MTDLSNRFKTPLDKAKLKVWGYPWPETKKSPVLSVSVLNNNVRLVAYMNLETESQEVARRPLTANMDPVIFGIFVQQLRKVIASDKVMELSIINKTADRNNQGAKTLQSEVIVGRGDNGLIYIKVKGPTRKVPCFPFSNSAWYDVTIDGEKATKAIVSNLVATAWIDRTEAIVNQLMVTHHIDEQVLRQEREQFMREREEREQKESNFKSGLPDDLGSIGTF